MTLKFHTTLFLLFICLKSISQQKINLIVSINDRIVSGLISNFRIVGAINDGKEIFASGHYYPGCLSLSSDGLNFINDSTIRKLRIVFDHTDYVSGEAVVFNYRIEISRNMLLGNYLIVYIYNMSKREYRKTYIHKKRDKYLFAIDYPGGYVGLVRKQQKNSR